jgi:hypothetical protein
MEATRLMGEPVMSSEDQEPAVTGSRPPSWWKVAPGVVWIQVHCPEHARALARVRGGRRVAYSVAGPYLRTYEFARTLRWAEKWQVAEWADLVLGPALMRDFLSWLGRQQRDLRNWYEDSRRNTADARSQF